MHRQECSKHTVRIQGEEGSKHGSEKESSNEESKKEEVEGKKRREREKVGRE